MNMNRDEFRKYYFIEKIREMLNVMDDILASNFIIDLKSPNAYGCAYDTIEIIKNELNNLQQILSE